MRKMRISTAIVSLFMAGILLAQTPVQAAEYGSGDENGYSAYDSEAAVTHSDGIEITKENFKDLYETALRYDSDDDGWLSDWELKLIKEVCIFDKVTGLDGLEQFTAADKVLIADFGGKVLTIPDACTNITSLYVEPTVSSVTIDAPNVKNVIISSVDEVAGTDNKSLCSQEIGPTKGKVTKVDLSACKAATYAVVRIENISTLVLPAKGNNLKVLELYNLAVKKLNLSNCSKVEYLDCTGCEKLTGLDTSAMKSLSAAYVYFCPKITKFNFSKNTKLKAVSTDKGTTASLPKGKKTVWYVDETASKVFEMKNEIKDKYQCCGANVAFSISKFEIMSEEYQTGKKIKIDKTNFPSFYKLLKDKTYDYNQDGWLSELEIRNTKSLTIKDEVSDLTGIDKLTSLKKLMIAKYKSKNLTITNPSIEYVLVEPYTKSFTVNAPEVKQLYVGMIYISDSGTFSNYHNGKTVTTAVDVSKCKGANSISIGMEEVSSLKLPSYKKNLAILELDRLKIKSINLSTYTNLRYLRCYYCENLTKFDVSKNTKLMGLWFCATKGRQLNLSKNKALEELCTNGTANHKATFAKGSSAYWSTRYNYGAYKIQGRVKAMYALSASY